MLKFILSIFFPPLVYWRQHESNSYRRSKAQTLEEIRVRKAIHQVGENWQVRGVSTNEIRRGLAANAMHLVPLLVLVNDITLARSIGWHAVKNHQDRKGALKRFLSLNLGADRARNHFWTIDDLAVVVVSEQEYASIPTLKINLPD